MELREIIEKRRSVRKFTDYYVTDTEIMELLEAARRAPSWANTQVWEFIVIRDTETIAAVTDTYSEKNPARKCSASSSVLIVACAKMNVSGCFKEKQATVFSEWFMFDLGMAVENICLRAHDLGLGTVVVGSMDHEKCGSILEVPEGYRVIAVMPVGRPLDTGKSGPPRKEIKDFVHSNTFAEPYVTEG